MWVSNETKVTQLFFYEGLENSLNNAHVCRLPDLKGNSSYPNFILIQQLNVTNFIFSYKLRVLMFRDIILHTKSKGVLGALNISVTKILPLD